MRQTSARGIRWLLPLLLVLVACSRSAEDPQGADGAPAAVRPANAAIAANDRAVGLMGQFRYLEAREIFDRLARENPGWLTARLNLAIATLNRQQEGDEDAALEILDAVLRAEPDNARANYLAGLLRLYLEPSADAALAHFRKVIAADAADAYAAYYLAQCLARQSQYGEALEWYRRAMTLDPYLRSAYYGAFQALQRLGRGAEAGELVSVYRRLADNPNSRLAEFRYTRMGPKAEVEAVNPASPATLPLPQGAVFAAPAALLPAASGTSGWPPAPPGRAVSITAADLQGDGLTDLFVAAPPGAQDHGSLVLLARPGGGFAADADHPLAQAGRVNAALWGDYDNDGLVDVYLCRQGPNQLWRQHPAGRWQDVTQATGTAGGTADTRSGALFDADHDGDLDLFLVNADAPNELLNNNLDGSFRALGAERGIAGSGAASIAVLPVDIDNDRDLDLVVINAVPPHEVYLNDRLWAYRPAQGFEAFSAAAALAAVAADLDADGAVELYTASPGGAVLRWLPGDDGVYRAQEVARPAGRGELAWRQLLVLDADGDGTLELLESGPAGWSIVTGSARHESRQAQGASLAGLAPLVADPAAGPALVGLQSGGLVLWAPGPGRYPFLALRLSGLETGAASMRSNASGLGAAVAVRAAARWTLLETLPQFSGPGQSLQPLAVGTGAAGRVEFIAIDWSNGVYQTELDLQAGRLHAVSETQRQLSSCPVLFAWDGHEYAFVSDVLGVGGIGYAIAPGEYAPPRPRENFLLEEGRLQAAAGRYRLKLSEPMEEVLYLDSAGLVRYELPPGWQMVLDERMGVNGPEPSGAAVYYRQERLPVRAHNDRGEDVRAALLQADGIAAAVGELDRRFIGRLRQQHVLTLEFDAALDAAPGAPVLVADGWVEYPYSQTSFAAWQAGAGLEAPTLEARGADGRWQLLLAQFGYPAGMPRRMSVPLPALPPGTTALRLHSNMEIYWDRLAVAYSEPLLQVRRTRLPLESARLRKSGFALRIQAGQRRPDYDYSRRSPFWDTRYLRGNYTRPGPVEELLAHVDDAVAIIGPGEEVHLEFRADGTEAAAGAGRRYFVLEARGWAKDMDLFTLDGESVGPLPASGKPAGPRDRLHARYNTRYLEGR